MRRKKEITILVIEDDTTMREGIQTVLEKEGFKVYSAVDGLEGTRFFHEHKPNLVITDLRLPGKSGMHLLREFQEKSPSVPIILISAYGTVDLAVNALKSGAKDFIAKPFSIDELKSKVFQIISDLSVDPSPSEPKATFHGMVGSSQEMKKLYKQVKQVAIVNSPVLITGESGTGKELIARAIHLESERKDKQFLAVNCGAFSDTLLESELFGHEKGAFTGAIRQHKGIFEQADSGTILLDEIGEVSQKMQVKLLRVLQGNPFQRVGGSHEISVDVRVIAATNRNMKEAIKAKQMREDLYFRLNVLPIEIPPLRDRQSDLPELINYFIDMKCKSLGKKHPIVPDEAINKLIQYSWPGNIRELENFIERLLIFTDGDKINASNIYFDTVSEEIMGRSDNLNDVLEQTEYEMITDALKKSGGIKQSAARRLGIKTSTLYYKMEKYNISGSSTGSTGESE